QRHVLERGFADGHGARQRVQDADLDGLRGAGGWRAEQGGAEDGRQDGGELPALHGVGSPRPGRTCAATCKGGTSASAAGTGAFPSRVRIAATRDTSDKNVGTSDKGDEKAGKRRSPPSRGQVGSGGSRPVCQTFSLFPPKRPTNPSDAAAAKIG